MHIQACFWSKTSGRYNSYSLLKIRCLSLKLILLIYTMTSQGIHMYGQELTIKESIAMYTTNFNFNYIFVAQNNYKSIFFHNHSPHLLFEVLTSWVPHLPSILKWFALLFMYIKLQSTSYNEMRDFYILNLAFLVRLTNTHLVTKAISNNIIALIRVVVLIELLKQFNLLNRSLGSNYVNSFINHTF